MKALIIGGTGPTGPALVEGLLQRGYRVTMLHRGTHEVEEIPPEVEHLHTDPHFRETLDAALAGRTFDLVLATYGRLRLIAQAVIGKTPRFIGVGGTPSYRGMLVPESNRPTGLPVPTPEDAPLVSSETEARFGYLVAQTEKAVMQANADGHYAATMFRYPLVYGPRQLSSPVWSVVQRILDKRPAMIVPDGGLTLLTRGYALNMAHAVLLAVDQPQASAGQIYNCGDEQMLTLRQWVEVISDTMGYTWDIVGVPDSVAHPARCLIPFQGAAYHQVMDLTKIKTELGYRDLVPARQAVADTVHWYLEHPPSPQALHSDPLNYAAEDALIALMQACITRMQAVAFERPAVYHSYPHPKEPGLQRDHRQR